MRRRGQVQRNGVNSLVACLIGLVVSVSSTTSSAQTITEIIDSTGAGAGKTLDRPQGLATDQDGNVYVAGNWSSNLFKIPPAGTITELIDGFVDGVGNFSSPVGVATDGANNVYVAASNNNAVFREALSPRLLMPRVTVLRAFLWPRRGEWRRTGITMCMWRHWAASCLRSRPQG